MKVVFDPQQDILQVCFKAASIEETSQIAPGLILDYDEDGNVIGLELRKASQRMDNPQGIDFSIGVANENKPQTLNRD
ncbi:MAG: DUF2283 domain-containing protein [Acaryochloridaceae cyanobacterium RL_2_7]|nr:DUF2283 domain-containing protein [Acaryochloridaceae cyanobacterium RL_2_7]